MFTGLPPTTSTQAPTQAPTTPKPAGQSSNSAAIGGSVGGIIAVVVAIVVVFCAWSKRRNRGQPETKPNVTMAYRNRGCIDVEQPTASGGKGEPYSGLSNARDKAPQGNVYDELDAASNGARALDKNEEAEYCYISDSDIKAAQRQSKNPIPSVRNNKSPGASNSESSPVSTSVGYNSSSGKKLSHFPSGKYSSMNDPMYQGQTGNQDSPSSPEYLEPRTHEYFVLEPEHTSL
ncbi:uncharacterized protein LOC110454361 [Mizuhopecten yessoensis]|uniref:uncharacterized protein LOC110454361 n=1 Tax=Mizuhopecten yessoensis TaxID=6573 RepID=UPI000B4572A2|nr:uncharacterized protein LOC110454361 [Mizuhopecten yessoensis]